MLTPWPSRQARQAAIDRAHLEHERSARQALHAQRLERHLRRMQEENHFAEDLAQQIIYGRD